MFEPLVMKVDESQVMRGVVFEPDDHELRFYQFPFEIREKKNWWGVVTGYELYNWSKWLELNPWDVIYLNEFDHHNPAIVKADVISENWERKRYSSRFPSEFEYVFKDNEWEYHIAESRWSSWPIFEDYFIEAYRDLDEEFNEDENAARSYFYKILEKRTCTYIKDFEFLDLSN